MRLVLSRPIMILTVGLLLSACQPSEPVRESGQSAAPSYDRVGKGPALKPAMSHDPLPDFGDIHDVATKKAAFFGFLRPLAEHQNAHLIQLREHLLKLEQAYTQQGGLHPSDQAWLDQLAELFRANANTPTEQFSILKRRVGRIPAAMILAQAANESAWGTSRFAREGNNLFGMWCFSPGCGLAPLARAEGATHEVAAYDSVEEGIYRYLINLNANSSYRELRQIRQCLRQEKRPFTGRALAAGLTSYSERGSHYVQELRAMMRINKLEEWASDWWGHQNPDHPCYPLVQVVIDEPDPIREVSEGSETPEIASAAPASPAQQAATNVN